LASPEAIGRFSQGICSWASEGKSMYMNDLLRRPREETCIGKARAWQVAMKERNRREVVGAEP